MLLKFQDYAGLLDILLSNWIPQLYLSKACAIRCYSSQRLAISANMRFKRIIFRIPHHSFPSPSSSQSHSSVRQPRTPRRGLRRRPERLLPPRPRCLVRDTAFNRQPERRGEAQRKPADHRTVRNDDQTQKDKRRDHQRRQQSRRTRRIYLHRQPALVAVLAVPIRSPMVSEECE